MSPTEIKNKQSSKHANKKSKGQLLNDETLKTINGGERVFPDAPEDRDFMIKREKNNKG